MRALKPGWSIAVKMCFTLAFSFLQDSAEAAQSSLVMNSPRLATAPEIQAIFELATYKPANIRLVAEVETITRPWTAEEITKEVEYQKQLMRREGLSPAAQDSLTIAQSNAVARSHSGRQFIRIQEWLSGRNYRLDTANWAMYSEATVHSNANRYFRTVVENVDASVSNSVSFSANHIHRDASITSIGRTNRSQFRWRLWEAFGLPEDLAVPVLLAIRDGSPAARAERLNGAPPRVDSKKLESLISGQWDRWRLHAEDLEEHGRKATLFRLVGQYAEFSADKNKQLPELQTIEAYYWLFRRTNGTPACYRAVLTNLVTRHSYRFEVDEMSPADEAKRWRLVTQNDNPKQVHVGVKEVDFGTIHPDAFSPKFATNYTVSEITAGQARILQRPNPGIPIAIPSTEKKRSFVVVILATMTLVPLIAFSAFLLQKKRRG